MSDVGDLKGAVPFEKQDALSTSDPQKWDELCVGKHEPLKLLCMSLSANELGIDVVNITLLFTSVWKDCAGPLFWKKCVIEMLL